MRPLAICCVALLLSFAPPPAAGQPLAQRPELIRAEAAAAETARRVTTSPAAWTADCTLGSGAVISIDRLRAGDRQRMVFHLTPPGGRRTEVLRIIQRDGLWYVTDERGAYKHRPYEYPAESPFVYLCLERSEPQAYDAGFFPADTRFQGTNGKIISLRRPLPPATLGQVRNGIAQLERLGEQRSPEQQALLRQLKDLADNGLLITVDQATGLLTEYGTEKLRTRFGPLTFPAAVDEQEFAIPDRNWKDLSGDPTAGDLNDLVMIGHDSRVRPGGKVYDLDGRLLNVRTGQARRLPFEGGVAMPGCFLKDRKGVIVCGTDIETGYLRPVQIDLKTGANKPLGGPELNACHVLGCDLSSDGKTLVISAVTPGDPLKTWSQLYTIDLATNATRPLGGRIDTAGAQWTADGKHVVLLDRNYASNGEGPAQTIVLMDMNGKTTPIVRGALPQMLADRKTILFEEPGTDLLQTCDLRGGNIKPLGDGMKGYGFPAPAPDGKRMLLMKFRAGDLPQPVIITIGEPGEKLATDAPGLWGMPVWR